MLPEKPLKILTIDGGGLQAISTLLILDKLLDTIAQNNQVPHGKPRPCDVFDTIAGIGAGGWLAILLGRFHMDITTCLSEWYKITQRIAPRSKTEEIRMRAMKHCYFNPDRLVQQIEALTKVYGTGEFLFDTGRAGEVRTRHVFVAALRSDSKKYNLFRTYEIPSDVAMPKRILEGPEDPARFKISSAFGVTGAAKYFSPPWNVRMSESGQSRFNDKFPNTHNITELALDEMWAVYGLQVEISVIVNIGPGLPSKHDVQQIAKRFSWGLRPPLTASFYSKRSRSPVSEELLPSKKKTKTDPPEETISAAERLSVRFLPATDQGLPSGAGKKQPLPRRDTVGSVQGRTVGKKLKRREAEIENDINAKLKEIYKEKGTGLYYRLAPHQAAKGTAQNDSWASGVTLDATMDYLGEDHTVNKMDDIAERIPLVPVTC